MKTNFQKTQIKMFRSANSVLFKTLSRSMTCARVSGPIQHVSEARRFSTTPVFLYAKKKGGKKDNSSKHQEAAAESSSSIASELDTKDIKKKMQESVEHFKERVTVIRQGKLTPSVIEAIMIKTHDKTEEPLGQIARVALKGPRNMTITVYDPLNVKHITAAVIASDLNLNPQPDPKSPEQILRIPLPPVTSETKKEIVKSLKQEFEHWKNSPAKKSLSTVREAALKSAKKLDLSKDDMFKTKTEVEDLFKEASKNLSDALKQAENAVMKE